ncbi:UvrD-helicase domain-containing protein [Bdellovibrio sp.]|uniref:UvrD-helicase domain-containing protein n=1 Tax=Bdellovibrio sp. TaxID=28201 RepID=UPI0039E65090
MTNRLLIAAAGAGKTTTLVKKAYSIADGNVLITTFTNANEQQIKGKFYELFGCIPRHVYVQSYWSFLLEHGVRPYQGCLYEGDIAGMHLVPGQSVPFIPEKQFKKHYLTGQGKVYSDKIAKLATRCNQKSEGKVIERLAKCFRYIFIDEIQDFASWDLEFFKLLFKSPIDVTMVGDPRQGTYSTTNGKKNKKFTRSHILDFFEEVSDEILKDDTSLSTNYRCIQEICDLADKLYPTFGTTKSGNQNCSGHDGVFFVDEKDISGYLDRFKPMQLRDSVATKVDPNYEVLNFGASKGLQFERVIIYPTKPMMLWLKDHSSQLTDKGRAKFYVALTRACQSVAIISNGKKQSVQGIQNFELEPLA